MMLSGPFPQWNNVRRVVGVEDDEICPSLVPEDARSSLHSLSRVPERFRFGVFAHDDASTTWDACGDPSEYVGLLLFELKQPASPTGGFTAIIHTFYVNPSCRHKGLGGSLIQHAFAMAVCHVQELLKSCSCSRRAVLTWELARGSCRRRPDTLLCLATQGWRVVQDGDKVLEMDTLSDWLVHDKDVSRLDVELFGPQTRVGVGLGCLSVAFPSGLSHFKTPQQLPAPPKDHRFKRSFQLCEETLMYPQPFLPGGVVTARDDLGLLPFVVPILYCQQLESFLADASKHSLTTGKEKNSGQMFMEHRLHLDDESSLIGYDKYSALNVTHWPELQGLRTLRTASIADVHKAIKVMPGLAQVLLEATDRIGLKLVQRELDKHILHLHFLYLDGTSQVDFDWHEDTFDLSIPSQKRDGVLSVIVQLSTSFSTAMQVHGFPYFEYKGQGCGVIFHGRCLHRTVSRQCVPSRYGVWKLAAFLHPQPSAPRNIHISNAIDLS